MTARLGTDSRPAGARSVPLVRWLAVAAETSRPRQWPKNLLVFAAPLAGASLGRDEGLGYALAAAGVFTAASAAVYFVNDVADADRDRRHPAKRLRPVASGRFSHTHALALAAFGVAAAEIVSFSIGEPTLAALVGGYIALSFLYTVLLKHIPFVELIFVAGGFMLRALGGAAATHVPPSGWFLVVCSLGALMVAISKRFTELTVLGEDAVRHRPVIRWYSPALLRLSQRVVTIVMITAYLLWASGQSGGWTRGWHLASALPLAAALVRFDYLTGGASGQPVEDLIARDGTMVCFELAWLALFAVGL